MNTSTVELLENNIQLLPSIMVIDKEYMRPSPADGFILINGKIIFTNQR